MHYIYHAYMRDAYVIACDLTPILQEAYYRNSTDTDYFDLQKMVAVSEVASRTAPTRSSDGRQNGAKKTNSAVPPAVPKIPDSLTRRVNVSTALARTNKGDTDKTQQNAARDVGSGGASATGSSKRKSGPKVPPFPNSKAVNNRGDTDDTQKTAEDTNTARERKSAPKIPNLPPNLPGPKRKMPPQIPKLPGATMTGPEVASGATMTGPEVASAAATLAHTSQTSKDHKKSPPPLLSIEAVDVPPHSSRIVSAGAATLQQNDTLDTEPNGASVSMKIGHSRPGERDRDRDQQAEEAPPGKEERTRGDRKMPRVRVKVKEVSFSAEAGPKFGFRRRSKMQQQTTVAGGIDSRVDNVRRTVDAGQNQRGVDAATGAATPTRSEQTKGKNKKKKRKKAKRAQRSDDDDDDDDDDISPIETAHQTDDDQDISPIDMAPVASLSMESLTTDSAGYDDSFHAEARIRVRTLHRSKKKPKMPKKAKQTQSADAVSPSTSAEEPFETGDQFGDTSGGYLDETETTNLERKDSRRKKKKKKDKQKKQLKRLLRRVARRANRHGFGISTKVIHACTSLTYQHADCII